MNWIIITAGGNGHRMKTRHNKIFSKIKNRSLIYWTLKLFHENKLIDRIVISVRSEDLNKVKKIVEKNKFKKVVQLVPADKTRQDSTYKVLKLLKDQANSNDLIGIHNAVNPFVSKKEIDEVFSSAKEYGAALLACQAKDTVKISDEKNLVKKTPIRNNSWYAQTPQVATFKSLLKAFTKAHKDDFLGTDDTQLLERIGMKVKVVPCSNLNFKITFPEDLIVARKVIESFI